MITSLSRLYKYCVFSFGSAETKCLILPCTYLKRSNEQKYFSHYCFYLNKLLVSLSSCSILSDGESWTKYYYIFRQQVQTLLSKCESSAYSIRNSKFSQFMIIPWLNSRVKFFRRDSGPSAEALNTHQMKGNATLTLSFIVVFVLDVQHQLQKVAAMLFLMTT